MRRLRSCVESGKIPDGIEAERWRLEVVGPLPYRRGQGEQHVAIKSFFSDYVNR
jgi:hypothetical protein